MRQPETDRYRDQLLIELIAERLQFDVLSESLPGAKIYPPYLLVATGILIEYGVFDLYNYVISGKNSFIVEPNSLAVPAMAILGVVGVNRIQNKYTDGIAALRLQNRETEIEPDVFKGLVSLRARVAVWILAVLAANAFGFFIVGWNTLIEIDGIGLFVFGTFVTFPLIYIPVLVEFGLSYFAVHFIVPRRLADPKVRLFFYDSQNLGGFGPIGELLKESYYFYTGVLLLYFVQTHAMVVLSSYLSSPYGTPGPIIQLVLTVGWLFGIVTIAYSMSRIHVLMKSQKETRIRELEDRLRETMEKPYDIHEVGIIDDEQHDEISTRLEHVRKTKTYPTTFTMWSQIFISVLLPQALNVAVQIPQ